MHICRETAQDEASHRPQIQSPHLPFAPPRIEKPRGLNPLSLLLMYVWARHDVQSWTQARGEKILAYERAYLSSIQFRNLTPDRFVVVSFQLTCTRLI